MDSDDLGTIYDRLYRGFDEIFLILPQKKHIWENLELDQKTVTVVISNGEKRSQFLCAQSLERFSNRRQESCVILQNCEKRLHRQICSNLKEMKGHLLAKR